MREGGSLLGQAQLLSARVFARVLAGRGVAELNPAQGRILFELWKEDGLGQGELARRTKLDKSSLALALDRMEAQGLAERARGEADGRRRVVRLGPAARRLRGALDLASADMTEIFYRGMDESERDRLDALLRKLIANLEAADA